MMDQIEDYFNRGLEVRRRFLQGHREKIKEAADKIVKALSSGNKVLIFGNGGSAADSQHMAAELVGRFRKERKAYPVLALTTNTSTLTALANDYSFEDVFARQIEAFLKPGDIVIAISTSGESENVIKAVELAKEMGGYIISFTGKGGGRLLSLSDIGFLVPSDETPIIQEVHITLAHLLCLLVEEQLG